MPIPTVVESEDQLPEGLSEYYEQAEDGTYVLSIEGVDSHPEVRNLSSSLKKQKQDREKLRQERDMLRERVSLIPDDMDNDAIQQAIDKARNSGKPDEEVERLKKQYQQQLQERDQQLQERDKKLRQTVAKGGLQSALIRAGVTKSGLQQGAMRLLQDQVKVQEADDGTLEPVADTDRGEVPLDQFVKNWLTTEEGRDYLPQGSGSGSRGGGPKGGGQGQIKRSEFDELSAADRMEAIRKGVQIVDE